MGEQPKPGERSFTITVKVKDDKYCHPDCIWGIRKEDIGGIITCALFDYESCWDVECGKNPNGTNEHSLRCDACKDAEKIKRES